MGSFADVLDNWKSQKGKLEELTYALFRVSRSLNVEGARKAVNKQRYDLAHSAYRDARNAEKQLKSMSLLRRYFNRKELRRVEEIVLYLEEQIGYCEEIEIEIMEKTLVNRMEDGQ